MAAIKANAHAWYSPLLSRRCKPPMDDVSLIPPQRTLYDGSSSPEEFVRFGEQFCQNILIPRGYLAPTSALLDVGCGQGAIARALTRYLTAPGRYEGIDVKRSAITWLQTQYKPFPCFRFTHVDVRNAKYNPSGACEGSAYRLPFSDESFDVVLLKSVFTHMLPADVRQYMLEIGRVLKPFGRSVMTFFLLNDESLRFIAAGGGAVPMNFEYAGDRSCRVMRRDLPEFAVAHAEERIRQFHRDARLIPLEIAFGDWCGRPALLGLQDLVIAHKA
jgi:SAM-dependent methyltransferase